MEPCCLVESVDGSLYGLTEKGGANDQGTSFRLDLDGVFSVLHFFSDGSKPNTLVESRDGHLYGTTASGGADDAGTLFQLTRDGRFTTLHAFNGEDGNSPNTLIESNDGSFYGTASSGGQAGDGVLFRLDLDCNGNGTADRLDISQGRSLDVDFNGVPDECAPRFLRGDCDADCDACSGVNDALAMLGWLFRGDARPSCVVACDSNGNGETELTDAVFGLDFCFKGTAPPPAPFPECGPGGEADLALGCGASSANCK